MTSCTLNFTISSSGGDGAYLCVEKVTKEIYEYFENNNLDLEQYALNEDYARENKIPEAMQPFAPGARAEFGSYECGMTAADHLNLTIENEDYEEIFSGDIPKSNVKKDNNASDSMKGAEKGVYAVGYEGLEDCYISGEFELNDDFDIKKFKVFYGYIDYKLGDRNLISSITYDNNELEWYLGSYEGTGDNSFGFVVVK